MKIKVIYKKVGRERIWAQAVGKNIIEIDPRATGKKELELLIHESLHLIYPTQEEEMIETNAITLTNLLWKIGYRKVDNSNHIPLQDGTI